MTRYFAQDTPRAGLEHMIMSVPGFQKRGGGMMILSRFCYKPEDVDCRYCLHYRRRSCQVHTCPYIAERLKSGAIEYLDLILEYFGHIPHAGLHKRIQAVEHWSGPDQAVLHTVSLHLRSRFADRVWDDTPPGYLAALYLLASKERLWQPALSALSHDSIDFSRIVSKPHGFAIQDYTSKWPTELKQKGVDDEPDRFDYILLTAKSLQALAPYQSRKDVSTAIDKALKYLSEQQLPSGGFVKYGDEDVEEDAAVLEMLAALGISLTDERFTKDGHTVLDGMMGWYQDFYFEEAENAPYQGFYRYDVKWGYNALWGGWYHSVSKVMPKPPSISPDEETFDMVVTTVLRRRYINPVAYTGLCSIRPVAKAASVAVNAPTPSASASENASTIGFSKLLDEQKALFEQEVSDGSLWNEDSWMVTESDIASFARDILALEKANGGFSEEEKAQLSELMKNMMLTSKEYYYKKKSKTLSCGAVRALVALGMDPGNVEGLDYLAPLTSLDGREFPQLDDLLKDVDAVDPNVWRARGIDADMLVDEYAAAMIEYQMPNGKFDDHYKYVLKQGEDWQTSKFTNKDQVELNAGAVAALAPHTDKEYIAKSVESAIEYLSSVQLADGSFPGRDGLPDGAATLAVLDMMDAAGISLNDERFVKNGNTVADGLKTFYIDGLGFVTRTEVDADVDGLTELPSYTSKLLDFPSAVSALTYLQAAENGKFGPDGKGNSVFEIVGAALTETPLGAILLAAIVAALLAFGMARRYRRIKKEQ